MHKFITRAAAFSALSTSLTLSGCLEARVVRVGTQQVAAATATQETFKSTNKMDVLVAVDPSNLASDQQKQITDSITSVLNELDQKGVDYHVGLAGAGGGVVNTFPISIPGFGTTPDSSSADAIAAGLGALTVLGNNSRYMTASQRQQLQSDLLNHVLLGVQNQLGSNTRSQFESNILPLLPIIVAAAQGGASKQDTDSITAMIEPMVLKAVNQGQLGGNYNQALQSVLPIAQMAAGSGSNNQKFDSILAALLPIAINVGLQSQANNPYVAAASVALPAILQLSAEAQHGASFDELMTSVIPIVLSQVGNDRSNNYTRMIAVVLPLVTTTMASMSQGKFDPRTLMVQLLPVALSSISNQGASSEYTYLLSAVMPMALNIIQDQKLGNDPNKTLQAVSQLGLATVLGALDKGKTGTGGVNAGFMRDDAILSVIMVGENSAAGEKQDPKVLANSFVNLLLDSKTGTKQKLAFDAIVGGDNNMCSSQTLKDTSVYKQIASLTNGSVEDLCNNPDKFGDILVSSILSKLTEYTLAQSADPSKVHVLVNGVEVPQSSSNGWSLLPDGKTIQLNGSYIPSANSEIVVKYVPVG